MIIDYIYLIIILIIIAIILFFIYLSYEYRIPDITESFIVPKINTPPNQNVFIKQKLSDFLSNYDNLSIAANNNQLAVDEKDYYDISKLTDLNKTNAKLLESEINGIKPPSEPFPEDKLIKTIKSRYNSQYLSLISNDIDRYGIITNDKCVTVKGLCNDDFCLKNCQDNLYTTDSQKFTTKRIHNNREAAQFMGKNYSNTYINSKNVYPFNIFQSSVNNNCLSITNDGITVEPCNVNSIYQQWDISPDENICVLK